MMMMICQRCMLGVTLLSLAFLALTTNAHVVLDYPFPRTNNDYLFSFDEGVCNPNDSTCGAFCGDPFDTPNAPVTVLPVGIPVSLRWQTTNVHPPFLYRIAVNPTPGGDANFDTNILTTVSNADARVGAVAGDAPTTGNCTTTVTFPASLLETCGNHNNDLPCVVQLFDLYYFVSCANVRFTADTSLVPADVLSVEEEEFDPFEQTTTTITSAACKGAMVLAAVACLFSFLKV